jgi:hypothetical protein
MASAHDGVHTTQTRTSGADRPAATSRMRSTTLPLGGLGREAIERYAEAHGTSASDAVRAASLYYLSDRHTEKRSWRVPRFLPSGESSGDGDAMRIDIDDATWAAIEREAALQGVSPALLLRHAVFYFLPSTPRRQS